MSKLKLGIAGSKFVGTKIKDLAKKLKRRKDTKISSCLLYTSPSPRDGLLSRMPSSA